MAGAAPCSACAWRCTANGMGQWSGAKAALNQGYRALEIQLSLNSVRKDPQQTARALGSRSDEVKGKLALGSLVCILC